MTLQYSHSYCHSKPACLRLLAFFCLLFLSLSSMAAPPEKIRLQLKWFSSFQFAGYYMALEKGYYQQAGLQVQILERDPSKNNVSQVVDGEAEYGVADSAILLYRAQGKPVKIMASIFQHSPLVFLSRKDSGIVSPYELHGKIVSYQKGLDDAPLLAMLREAGLGESDYRFAPLDFSAGAFIRKEVDVMSAYLSDEPFLLKEKGIDVNIINPLSYGIDFYGDNLFTTEQELEHHPERAQAFLKASLAGWKYALAHKQETIALLQSKYGCTYSTAHLTEEARVIEQMILPNIIEIGYSNIDRFVRIAQIYQNIGKITPNQSKSTLDGLIYDPNQSKDSLSRYLYVSTTILALLVVVVVVLLIVRSRLQNVIRKRTEELTEQQKMVDKYVIITATDRTGKLSYISDAFCQISGFSREELLGQNFRVMSHPDMPDSRLAEMWQTVSREQHWQGEIDNRKKDGSHYWVHTNIEPMINAQGEHIGYRAIHQDITDKKRVERLAVTDHLTHAYNRAYMDAVLQKELAAAKRNMGSFAIILLDIDHFKSVNDEHGHPVGDIVLKEAAHLLSQHIRTNDTFGRWGGEEFLIITPDTNLEGAMALAEKLRALMAGFAFDVVGHKTASFGVSAYQAGDSCDSLLMRVDLALYRAKHHGRNRVEGEASLQTPAP